MKIGIISDTHDRLNMIDQAVAFFNKENTELVLHAGDFISPFSAIRFSGLRCPVVGVFGNNDGDHRNLTAKFESFGAKVSELLAQVEIDEKKIAILHGDRQELLQTVIQSSVFDLVVSGHTHAFEVKKVRDTLVMNPGECCGYLSGNCTVGIFDTESCKTLKIDLGSNECMLM